MSKLPRLFIKAGLFIAIPVIILGVAAYAYMVFGLPDTTALKNIKYQVPMRIFTSDGKLLAEYGEKKRLPVSIDQVPPLFINAFVATEDRRFYENQGVDPLGLVRAVIANIIKGHRAQGGSTITMQVARNFFLDRKKTYTRKLREILLAIKMSSELDKKKILELYLNKIYLGSRAYGIAAAAQIYYGKQLSQLTLAQMAMIAGLPKAPSANNPLANPKAAIIRRNIVLENMYDQHYIDKKSYVDAIHAPITASYHGLHIQMYAPYIAEQVRQEMMARYGKDAYTQGYQVYTTVSSDLQTAARQAVTKALLDYDMRHGYRGPESNLGALPQDSFTGWQKKLSKISTIAGLKPAAIIAVQAQSATALFADGTQATIPWKGLSWAAPALGDTGFVGGAVTQADEVVKVGDVVRLRHHGSAWWLSQLPQVQGALVALQPNNGAVLALVGGFDYSLSGFNRVYQAQRQTGSNFKPFLYTAALAHGMTLATMVSNAAIVMQGANDDELWRPQNDTKTFSGLMSVRNALMKSVNLVSVRILQQIGIPDAREFISSHFGISIEQLPDGLSLALGSGEMTPLQVADGYAVLANGGYSVKPFLISRIQSSSGKDIFNAHPATVCGTQCSDNEIPAKRVLSAQVAYLMTSAMQDVIKKGTGRGALVLNRSDLSGKTGTTNAQQDAWFSGFNQDIVTTAWVGFDQPRSLREYGAQAALPMWVDFMRNALRGKAEHSMAQPQGLVSVRINPKTGLAASSNDANTSFEIFRQDNIPHAETLVTNTKSTNTETEELY